MNDSFVMRASKQSKAGTIVPTCKHLIMIGVAALAVAIPVLGQNSELQQKLAVVKQSVAENKQRLRQYQWIETTQLNLKGDDKPASQNLCQYGPDGQVQKSPIGVPPPPPSGGRMKQKIIAKKKAEIKDYMGDVKALLSMYVPPDPQKMEQAYQAGKVSFNPAGGLINLIFKDYTQPGDQMTLTFDLGTKKITSVSINTYMDDPKEVVTLQVQMASLPDGTNYVQRTVLDASAKKLVVTTSNASYQKMGG
jgi:hypothetical protein